MGFLTPDGILASLRLCERHIPIFEDHHVAYSYTHDPWYNLRIESDGADVTVWRWADGELETMVLETASASVTTTGSVMLCGRPGFPVDFDDVRILADGLSNTTTFAVNNANELTSMADRNGSTTFGFDAWGRMTSKARGSYTAAYGYRYGQMLCSVDSDFPQEGDVTYEYGGDDKRRSRTADSSTTQYNWMSWHVINEEDGSGNLQKTYIGHTLADVDGSNPATGAYRYYTQDILGSTASLTDSSKDAIGNIAYEPYGGTMAATGEMAPAQFTGHDNDPQVGLYYTAYRYYSPDTTRWIARDPLRFIESPNLYLYVSANPIKHVDPLGLAQASNIPYPYFPADGLPEGTSDDLREKNREMQGSD